jgi:UDP-N-acetylmuramoyl-tripeptide--D-alanyl-D-alanine ligase
MPAYQLTLQDVVEATGGELRGQAPAALPLSGVSHDSREIRPGALFVALRGPQHDGHGFVAEAFARGAAAALVERVPPDVLAQDGEGPPVVVVPSTPDGLRDLARWWRDGQPGEVVAVAGSIGRGTTAELCAAVLRQRHRAIHSSPTRRADVALPLTLLTLRPEVARLVVEVSPTSDAQVRAVLELARPCALVVSSLQAVRVEPDEAVETRARRTASLVGSLPAGGVAVLNADEPRVRALPVGPGATSVTFGLEPGAEVRAENVVGHGAGGITFDLVVERRSVHVRLPLLGLHSVHAALAAAALGVGSGLDLREIGAGLQTASREPRIIVASGLNGSRVIDDSTNASPESCLAALNLLAGLSGRKIAVLGDMLGLEPHEAAGHRKVGNRAASVASLLLTVGQRATLIADEARRMGLADAAVFEAPSNAAAIDYLRHHLRPGDVVLVKGARELEMERIVEAIRLEA